MYYKLCSVSNTLISEKKGGDLSNNDNLEYVSLDILNVDAVKVQPIVVTDCCF